MTTLTCHNCKKTFEADRPDRKFCSSKCRQIGSRKFQPILCAVCGKKFRPDAPDRKYCSKACFKSRPSKNRRTCEMCGKEFDPDSNIRKFCSNECRNKAWGTVREAGGEYRFGLSHARIRVTAGGHDLDDPANKELREKAAKKVLLAIANANGTLDVLLRNSPQHSH